MNKLIEKIEAKKSYYGVNYAKIQAYKQGKQDAIDIIKSELEPKSQPDSEGWWWCETTDKKGFVEVYTGRKEGEYDYPMWCDKKFAKWIKAIIPDK